MGRHYYGGGLEHRQACLISVSAVQISMEKIVDIAILVPHTTRNTSDHIITDTLELLIPLPSCKHYDTAFMHQVFVPKNCSNSATGAERPPYLLCYLPSRSIAAIDVHTGRFSPLLTVIRYFLNKATRRQFPLRGCNSRNCVQTGGFTTTTLSDLCKCNMKKYEGDGLKSFGIERFMTSRG